MHCQDFVWKLGLLSRDTKNSILVGTWCFSISDKFFDCTDYVYEILGQKAFINVNTKRRRESVRNFTKRAPNTDYVEKTEDALELE